MDYEIKKKLWLFYSLRVFHTSFYWWFFTWGRVTASHLKYLMTLLADLINIGIWMVSILLQISGHPSSFFRPIIIIITTIIIIIIIIIISNSGGSNSRSIYFVNIQHNIKYRNKIIRKSIYIYVKKNFCCCWFKERKKYIFQNELVHSEIFIF